jgi:uncharacterized protein YidB (DUF937 family)
VSILETLAGVVEKHPDLSGEQHNELLNTATEMFGHAGGLSSLLGNAQSQGLGHIVGSWIGTGPNQSVSPEQAQSLAGQDRISELARRVRISPTLASTALARVLPVLVDKLTPHGKLPQAA